jgi:hypothetical protein
VPRLEELAEAVGQLLQALCHGGDPVILFLDDLHLADLGTQALLELLPNWTAGSRVWILAALVPPLLAADRPLDRLLARDGDGVVTCVGLDRLERSDLEEIASAVTDPPAVEALTTLLFGASEGLPLGVVALVNAMWDEGELAPSGRQSWTFSGSPPPANPGARLDRVLLRRVRRLPTSTRRLASAACRPRFDTMLRQAGRTDRRRSRSRPAPAALAGPAAGTVGATGRRRSRQSGTRWQGALPVPARRICRVPGLNRRVGSSPGGRSPQALHPTDPGSGETSPSLSPGGKANRAPVAPAGRQRLAAADPLGRAAQPGAIGLARLCRAESRNRIGAPEKSATGPLPFPRR